MKELKELTVTVRLILDEEEQNRLAELVDLKREYDIVRYGHFCSESCYAEDWLLQLAFSRAMFNGLLDDELAFQKRLLHYWKVRHASDEAELEPETVSNSDEAAPGDVPTRNSSLDEATPDEAEPETVPNAEEEAPGDKESEPDGEEDFLTLAPLPCSYLHDPTVQDTPYDPARYEGDAYECGGCVVENPETLAFVDALTEALCR